jgi:plastocyanin
MSRTISSTYTTGIVLTSTANNPVKVTGKISVASGIALHGTQGAAFNWTVQNYGTIISNAISPVSTALFLGAYTTSISTGTVVNESGGLISGSGYGVFINAATGASVTNLAGGTIVGGAFKSVYISGGPGTIVNGGFLQGGNVAVYEYLGGSLTNLSTGTIIGNGGVWFQRAATLTNAGTITSTNSGRGSVIFNSTAGSSRVIVDPGAVFNGNLQSLAGSTNVVELASGASAGTLTGLNGGTITNFATLQFDNNASWTVSGNTLATGLGTIDITGFAAGDTIDLTGFVATSDTFGSNLVTFTNAATQHGTIHLQGSFSSTNLQFASDGSAGTDIFVGTVTLPPDLIYGQTIDETGIIATSETVAAGTLTLRNGVSAVGTINVGISLVSSDFTLRSDGGSGTDVIVSTVFGTYTSGVTLSANPTTIAATASVSSNASDGFAVLGNSPTLWNLTNLGTITETNVNGYGVYLQGGGTVVNAGKITAATAGVYMGPPGSVTNLSTGTIIGTANNGSGVMLYGGGSVTNGQSGTATGLIQGTRYGVSTNNGNVTNFATIKATGTFAADYGISLLNPGTISNLGPASLIEGYRAIGALSGGTVINAGTIESNGGTAGVAIKFGSGSARLIDDPGAVFIGSVSGGTGIAVMELASASSAGTIAGFGTSITNFTSLLFDTGAQWNVSGNDSASGLGTLGISGFTFGDTIDLTGFVTTGETYASGLLTLTNATASSTLHFAGGSFTTANFVFAGDAHGGTDITLQNPEVIGGAAVGQTVNDNGTILPFSALTISDPNSPIQAQSFTITVSNGGTATDADGILSGASLTHAGIGSYTLTAFSPATATAELSALVFTPTAHQVAPGGTVTTSFLLAEVDTAGAKTSNAVTTVVTTAVNDVPAISGTAAGQTMIDTATNLPFSGATISDPDFGATETLTITLKASGVASDADGMLSGFGLTQSSIGTYTLATGTPATLTAELEALVFAPTHHQVAAGGTVTTGMTLSVTDGIAGSPTADTVTTVVTTATAIVACFRAGTHIATPRGEVAVEDLRVGDLVLTISGQTQPIAWIGRRTLDCRRHPAPERVNPIRVAPHAFGENRPKRALLLSPDHSVFVEDVLIPIKFLVNGATIVQLDVASVTYYHLELPRHDVVLAEGLPTESYLETGGRSAFENGGGVTQLHPDFAADEAHAGIVWEQQGYAPLLGSDGQFDRVRARLVAQAFMLGEPPKRVKRRAG